MAKFKSSQKTMEKIRKEIREAGNPLDRYRIGPGKYFIPISHRAYWLTDDQRQRLGPWIDALEQFDKFRKQEPLLALLRSQPIPPEVGLYLADLWERYEHVRPKNRPRAPAYGLTKTESRLRLAKEFVDKGRTVSEAAEDWSLDKNTLENFCLGKRGSSRRMKKRRSLRP